MATNDQGSNQGSNQGNNQASKQGSKQGAKTGSEQSDNTKKRGFASMDPEQQREIAAEGGRAAHEKGTAHEFTSEEARRAGAMSHKNDGSRASASAGNKGSASVEGRGEDDSGGKGGRGGARSK